MDDMIRPETVLENWKAIREDSALAVEQMPAGKLDFKPQADMMGFREIAIHIIDTGRALTGLLLDNETDLSTPDFRQKLGKYVKPLPDDADAPAIAAAMRSSIAEQCEALAGKSSDFLAGFIIKWDGVKLTRLEMVQFVKEHELTHRTHLFMYLRMNGVVPPTTRRKMEKK